MGAFTRGLPIEVCDARGLTPAGLTAVGLTALVPAAAAAVRGLAEKPPRREIVHTRAVSAAMVAERRVNSMSLPQRCVVMSEPQPIYEFGERNTREPRHP